MDILGLLAGVVAIAVFPGGLFLAALTVVVVRAGRVPLGQGGWTAGALVALAAIGAAAALLPLPGSPSLSLPPDSGVRPNLFGLLVLLAVALSAAGEAAWPLRRLGAAVAAAGPVLGVSAVAGSLSFPVVLDVPPLALGRTLAGTAMLLVTPSLVRLRASDSPAPLRAAAFAVVAGVGLLLVTPSRLLEQDGRLSAAMFVAGLAAMAAVTRAIRAPRDETFLTAVATVLGALSVIASIASTR